MPETNNTVRVGALQVRAIVQPDTLNEDERTVEVVFGTDTPVRMYTYDGPVWEILSFDAQHVNLSRMLSGAPLLDNHSRYGSVTENVLGVVESASVDGTRGFAKLRFSKSEKGERAMAEVKDKILRNISVGYSVAKYEVTKAAVPGTMDTYRAIDWTPYEVSLVPVGADADAQVRNEKETAAAGFPTAVEIVFTHSNSSRTMKDGQNDAPETPAAVPTPVAQPAAPTAPETGEARNAGVMQERTRHRDINDAVRAAGLDGSFGEKLISDGTQIDQARALIISELATRSAATPTDGANGGASVGTDRTAEATRAAASDALFLRAKPGTANDVITGERRQAAERYRGMSLLDIARESLEKIGVNTRGMDKMEIAKRAITSSTSDFPVLLAGTNHRVLLAAYQAVPDTWREFCHVGSVSDFRPFARIRRGTFSNLDTVPETAEYKTKKLTDGQAETISAKTKGNIVNVSRQMIVNDDLGAFTDIADRLGRAAARSIEADVYALLALNAGLGPVMADGNTLFHASHGNIATAAAPTIAAVDAMRQQIGSQLDQDGNDYLDLRLSLALAPLSLGSALRVINDAQYNVDVTSKFQVPNQVRGLFNKVVDSPRLSGTAWYGFANPMDEPVLEVAFLDGVQTPYLEQDMPFQVDGIQWKIRLDYGVGAIGYRGAIRNAGV